MVRSLAMSLKWCYLPFTVAFSFLCSKCWRVTVGGGWGKGKGDMTGWDHKMLRLLCQPRGNSGGVIVLKQIAVNVKWPSNTEFTAWSKTCAWNSCNFKICLHTAVYLILHVINWMNIKVFVWFLNLVSVSSQPELWDANRRCITAIRSSLH